MTHKRARFSLRSAIPLSLAVGLFATNIAGLYHYATVRHVRCAEHGEKMHGQQAARSPGEASDSWLAAGPDADAGHEHCNIDPWTRDQLSEARVAIAAAPPAGAVHDVAMAGDRARVVAVFRIAPKGSPPRA